VFVCILPEKAVPEMTCTMSGGTLNPTHSLTHSTWCCNEHCCYNIGAINKFSSYLILNICTPLSWIFTGWAKKWHKLFIW